MCIQHAFIPTPAGLPIGLTHQSLTQRHVRHTMNRRRRSKWYCSTAETRLIETGDGGTLSVDIYNANNQVTKTALLLHDFMTDKRLYAWLALEPELQDCMLIAPDLRGFGASSRPQRPYTRADDLTAVLRAVALPDTAVHVVGSGMGGTVALDFALHSEACVRSVAVLASGLPGHVWSSDKFVNISAPRLGGRLLHSVDRAAAECAMHDATNAVKWKRSFIAANSTWGDVLRTGDKRVAHALLDMARDYGAFHMFYDDPVMPRVHDSPLLLDRLQLVRPPVLVMVGQKDTEDFRKIAQEIWDRVPNREDAVVMLDDAGHFLSLEKPHVVAEELSRFWQLQ